MIKTLHTSSAPAAIGPYSQGKIVDGFLFASGQIAINPANGNIEEDTICLLYTSPSPRDCS